MSLFGSIASAFGSALPSVVSAGADLLGAHWSHKDNQRQMNLSQGQFDAQMDETLQRRVADGLKAGINPLAAIGASANVSPTIHSAGGSDTGGFISRAGEHLANLFRQKQEDDIEYDSKAKELDLESKRLENRILRNRAAESELNLKQGAGKEVSVDEPSMIGESLLFKPVYDLHGRPRLVINQDAIEADSDNPGYMSSIINAIGNAMINNQITPDGRVTSPQLQMMLDDFYYQTSGHHIKNLESLYISPTEAAMAATMLARGVS